MPVLLFEGNSIDLKWEKNVFSEGFKAAMSCDETMANLRNNLLRFKHNDDIPAYALWTAEDITSETDTEKRQWFRSFLRLGRH